MDFPHLPPATVMRVIFKTLTGKEGIYRIEGSRYGDADKQAAWLIYLYFIDFQRWDILAACRYFADEKTITAEGFYTRIAVLRKTVTGTGASKRVLERFKYLLNEEAKLQNARVQKAAR